MSQLVGFAGASSGLGGFGCRNGALAARLLGPGRHCFKIRKAFSKFYRRRGTLLEKYSVSLGALLRRCVSEPEFCIDLVCGFGGIVGESGFSGRFGKLINHYRGWGAGGGGGGGGAGWLAVAWMLCGGLRAWLSARSLLMVVLRSLVARRRFGPQTQ